MNIVKNIKSWFSRKQIVRPRFTLSDADKLYMATAIKHSSKLSFVYVLACHKAPDGQFALAPVTEVMTFDNANTAYIYHETVTQVMALQQSLPGPKMIAETLQDRIATFHQNTK